MNNDELYKKIHELFEELQLLNYEIPIIVEGKNDESALRELGMVGEILKLNTGQSILDFCEEIANKHHEVILLMDWDVKGQQLFKRLKRYFKPAKVKTNDKYWRKLKKYCSKEISEIEQLVKYKDIG